ncbi:uncharacterized protein LOC143912686 [Arctopsyche grandis]|uniref:uncharacterized protein LOC143912686 n=1 Tax=Arctopsyche grandis TaxID=121162 RepID=UPI00406D76D8
MTIVSYSERTMLQPRAMAARNRAESVNLFADNHKNNTSVGGDSIRRRKMAAIGGITKSIGIYAIVSLIFLSGFTLCQGNHNEEIAAERVKRDVTSGDGDVTTVLLVDNQKLNKDINARNGRYLNVKPVIGLLTSTARTFIQDGVTTEYATEILGTTLDNGRVYAQLLTKSSLVLYDKPIDANPERKTRLPFEMDDRNRWNLEQNLGELDRSQFVIKNTDYVSPKDDGDLFTVYASKPVQNTYATIWNSGPQFRDEVTTENEVESQTENLRVQEVKEIPKYNEFEAFNFLDPIPLPRERKISSYNNINIEIKNDERTNKAISISSDSNENLISQNKKSQSKGIDPVKVNPNVKLPTYTVKNEFSPIFYYIDNVESKTEKSSSAPNYLKSAKKLFGHKDEHKPLKTFTYYGFSNFTTIVGDTVIIFSPSTATEVTKPEEITPSVKPEVQPNVATRVKTFLSSDLNMLTKTMFGHQLNMETAIPTIVMSPQDLDRSSKALKNDEETLKTALYEKPMQEEEQVLKPDDKFSRVIASLKEGLFNRQKPQFVNNKDVIQTSEMTYSTILRTHSTEKLHVNEETIKDDKVFTIKSTEPLSLFSPTSVLQPGEVEKETSIPETTTASLSEEIVTEVESTTENDSETSPFTEDTLSTPPEEEEEEEEETNEEIESHSEDATCTGGIIPVSTLTTSYKTLTYLTSYFIPLEGTETSTSIKSSEVVTSETGYLTNLACKTEETVTIEPTLTLTEQIDSTKSIQTEEEVVTEANAPVLTTTSEAPIEEQTTTEKVKETTESIETTTQSDNDNKITIDDKSVDYSTTEHAVTTSESHIEISVTTEESAVSLDSRNNVETTTESKEETTTESEGEIDLIFKTLYTTYTYFTTYFQGETSTVSSKKSVVTNVITSTLDISEIDPSIFNAIESSDYLFKATQMEELGDIQPTSVGIGRPTQAFSLNSIIDLVQHRQVIDSVQNDAILTSKIQTPELDDEKLFNDVKADVVKTFYTTYTFFTTLYVEQDANICSRTEVYTNYVGPSSLIPTKTSQMNSLNTRSNEIDFKNCKKVPADQLVKQDKETLEIEAAKPKQQTYSSIDRSNKKSAEISTETSGSDLEDDINEVVLNSGDSMLVTDVKRSYSKGDRQIIDNFVLDDQVSSESNIDEILPSPTLLLQTSFTTFTYFTTMYVGKDSSKVKSRLETVTNVVTETLNPKSVEVEETNLPITYYTTFTYWTTLYKDKTTTITSREDIVSNVVTPTVQSVTANPIDTSPIEVSTVQIVATHKEKSDDDEETTNTPVTALDDLLSDDGKATFFTTYTYFTTYYVGNTSELRSSLETITNVVDNTKDLVNENQIGRAVGKDSPSGNLIGGDEKPVIVSTVLPDGIVPTKVSENIIVSTQLVGTLNEVDLDKKIISSQVAIISGDSTIISGSQNDNDSTTPKDEDSILTTPGITTIEGSVTEPTTPQDGEDEGYEDEDGDPNDENNTRKKSRLTFSTRKRTFTPVIRPFVSRTRSTFSPKRVTLTSGATTITRSDFTQTITATPALKSSKTSGFGGNRKQPSSAYPGGAGGRGRFSRTSSGIAATSSSASRTSGFGRGRSSDIQPANARRGGFRTSTTRANVDFSSRGVNPKIRPTLSSKYRGNKQTTTPSLNDDTLATATENPSTGDDESATQSTDVESRKTTNPLLRFRRPPFTRAQGSTTPRSVAQTTTRRGSFNRGRAGSATTTQKPTQRSTQNPLFALRNRQRPNALFPPRGLINKQPEPQTEEETNAENENDENEDDLEGEGADEDSDYESSDRDESQILTTTTTPAPKRISNSPAIKPFGFRRRSKRQTDYGTRRSYANFRRPTARTPKPEPVTSEPEPEVINKPPPKRTQGRFSSRNSAQQTPKPATRAPATTKPAIKGRQPFILRGESKNTSPTTQRSTFRSRSARPTSRTASPAPNLRPKAPRLKTYATAQPEAPRSTSRSSNRRTTSRGRTTSRYRTTTNEVVDNSFVNYQIPNDGKLTITHKIPMEVTIPVVNGKLTEYKNVLTAQPSIEILQPNQYSTTKNAFGSQYTVLVSESSIPAENGVTKVIQFILHETPTTSVIFTPTVINRRKTSFSHIIPSTVYEVERVTSTIQPQINSNVPLANILLSQLLLGNLGMPQPINPLLALQGQAGIPQTPTTEYKIKTTTYVTTVTDAKSTVIPITFRGKEILTTIIDSKVDVITATEFITETVVVTPTLGYQGVGQNTNQINSILLLLQQQQVQQQQQQQQQQTANPLLGLQPELNQQLFSNDLLNSPKPEVLDVKDPEDYLGDFVDEEVTRAPKRPTRRKTVKNKKPAPVQQTNIITLYVSGRTPGEFSTVLSTVVVDETQSVQKREAVYFEEYDVTPPNLSNFNEVVVSSQSDFMLDSFLMPAMNDISHNTITQAETQSLESIIGEVSKYMALEKSSSILETAASDPTIVYVVKQSDEMTGR